MSKTTRHTRLTGYICQPLLTLLLIAAGAMVYSHCLQAPFVFDDIPNIVQNPHIRITGITPDAIQGVLEGPSASRPLVMFTFAINYLIGKYNVFGYHLVNLLIHLVTAVLIMTITRQSLRLLDYSEKSGIKVAFFAAMLWLINPVLTQSVTFTVQRMNAMATMFYLMTLVCYIQARLRQVNKTGTTFTIIILYFIGSLSAVSALASKPNSATLPFFVFLYEWYFFQHLESSWLKRQLKWLLAIMAVFVLLGLVYTGWDPLNGLISQYAEQSFTPVQRLLTESGVILYYLSLLFWPHPDRLILDYDFPLATGPLSPPVTALSLLALTALVLLAGYAAKKNRLLSFTVIWFLGTLLIESSIIGLALIFEHRTYLPAVFPAIAVSYLFCRRIRPHPLALGLLIAAIGVCGVWTWQRNQTWANKIDLWQDVVNKSPAKARPWNGLGQALHETGQLEKALKYFQKSAALDPSYAEAHNNIGGTLLDMGQPQRAIAHLQQALAVNPESYQAFDNMGSAWQHLGNFEKAVQYYRQALKVYPDYTKTHNNLGNALLKLGAKTEAVYHLKKAIRINPGYAEAYNNLGLAMDSQGQTNRAVACYHQAVKLNPSYAIAHFNLGTIYFKKGQIDQAGHHLEKAVTHDPEAVLALNNLATIRVMQKRYPAAIKVLQQLAEIRPESPTVFYNLACVYSLMDEVETALSHLEKAIALGYNRWHHLRTDPDLNNIRSSERFQKLLLTE